MKSGLKIGIIGSGISGLVTAALLHDRHDVTIFEADRHVGGHTNTVSIRLDGEEYDVDTGFIVFNERTYPNFIRLLDQLGVASRPTAMSFSVRCDRTGVEYNGTSLNGLFAQRRNLLRPSFHQMLRDILRFHRDAGRLVDDLSSTATVAEFLARYRFSRPFADQYLLPMGAAIWSCPTAAFGDFPIRFIVEFFTNHGLLQLRDRPVWRVISGGSRRYVDRLTEPFRHRIRLRSPVHEVRRDPQGVTIESAWGRETFDEVVFACHSDQALGLLSDADATEVGILREFPYSRNHAVLHTDESVLPRQRRAWASWNYHIPAVPRQRPTVTYCMNILQHLPCHQTVCVTLNPAGGIDPSRVLGEYDYAHPIFTTTRAAAQARHGELIRRRRTSYCGAYWGNGFHEDGVNSALAVCSRFGVDRTDWRLASSADGAAGLGASSILQAGGRHGR